MSDEAEIILTNSTAPKKVSGDSGSAEQHSIPDQIAAANFANPKLKTRANGIGIRRVTLVTPGAV